MGLLEPPALTKPLADASYARLVDLAPTAMTNPGVVLPRITVRTTTGTSPTDTTTYLNGTVTINGPQPYSGTTQIRGRGNTTWTAPKKPWRLKLTTAASLLGMPAARDWVLLANAFDPLMIRNALALELGSRCSGLPWTPKFRFVELTLNDVYMGVFQLGEHVAVGPQKINITKATGTTGLSLAGGYSLEIDWRLDATTGFRTTTKNLPIILDDPDGSVVEQADYIKAWLNNFETVLYGPNWLDPVNGYAPLIDRNSFIDWYLVEELSRNLDSQFSTSVKLYKTADTPTVPGKLFLGPLWDFDNSFNNNFGAATPASGIYTRLAGTGATPGAVWIDRMFADPAFFAAVVTRWNQLKAAVLTGDTAFAMIDRMIDQLNLAAARDRRTWSYSVDPGVSGDALKAWIRTRVNYLSTQFVVDTTPPTVPTALTATPGDTQVVLGWTASTDDVVVAGYKVRRGGTLIASPSGTSFIDTGRTNGTAYSYTVSAFDAAGNESAQTAAVTATPAGGAGLPAVTSGTLLAWYKSDAITGLSDGAALTTWPDSAGGSYPLSPGGTAPVFKTNQLNSKPAVRFDRTLASRMVNDTLNQAQPATVFVVFRAAASVTAVQYLIASGVTSAYSGLYLTTAQKVALWGNTYGPETVAGTLTNAHVTEGVFNGASSVVALDGATSSAVNGGPNGFNKLSLGCNASRGNEFFAGDLFEVAIYSGALSAADRSSIRSALATRYGLTVS